MNTRRLIDPHVCLFVEATETPGRLRYHVGQHGYRMDGFTLQATVLAAAAVICHQTERPELAVALNTHAKALADLGEAIRNIEADIEETE